MSEDCPKGLQKLIDSRGMSHDALRQANNIRGIGESQVNALIRQRAETVRKSQDMRRATRFVSFDTIYPRAIAMIWKKGVYTKDEDGNPISLEPKDVCGRLKIIKGAYERKELTVQEMAWFNKCVNYHSKGGRHKGKSFLGCYHWEMLQQIAEKYKQRE